MDKKLLIITTILFLCGLVMVYSASNVMAYMYNEVEPARYFIRELVFLATGLFGCFIFIRFKTKAYGLVSWIAIISMIITIIGLIIYGTAMNGSKSWIGYNGYGIQPSEFAKIFMIPLMASYYDTNMKYNDNWLRMLIPLFITVLLTILMILQGDYGSAFLYLIVSVSMFFMAPVSKKIKMGVLFSGLFVAVMGILLLVFAGDKLIGSDKLERFNYSKPCERYLGSGNQLCNGYIAINSGGIFGKGLGNSTQKYLYLPEAHTDFIFAIIIEEMGLLGGVVLLLLYGYFLIRVVVIGKKSVKPVHKMLCYGIALYFFFHIIINLGGVIGITPLTGIPLAFMSYGGSFCWATLIGITYIQRVNHELKMQKV